MRATGTDTLKKILIIQTAYPGDVILTTSLAEAAARLFPGTAIHFLAIPSAAGLLKNNPFIHQVLIYDKKGAEKGIRALLAWSRRLKNERFDMALIPHRSLRSAWLARSAGIGRRIGFDRSAGSFWLSDVVHYDPRIHEVERNHALLSPLGNAGAAPAPKLYPGEEEEAAVRTFLKASGIPAHSRFITMAPGSVWPTKQWLPEGFAQTARMLWERHAVYSILLGGKKEEALAEEIRSMGGEGVINSAGALSLLDSAPLIKKSQVLVSNDSAPGHVAAAVGKSVVSIFGPTSPEHGLGPYGTGHTVVQRDLYCRPCGAHGGKRCPEGHFRCMREIQAGTVLQAVEKYLT